MKRFLAICGLWTACFVLLFLLYFVSDFYVIVGSGPRSWKKPEPLSFGERLFLSCLAATAITLVVGFSVAAVYYFYRATQWLRKARR
jgi:hypothetical protein